ncbi:MAG: bifunctional diaminohydroxyphosphoribosylaminopyrimidine deaminase/5-amino-6-(5-phosphoribosylamino)uracil reductase RibD [Rhodomicrobiaceae bacterium]
MSGADTGSGAANPHSYFMDKANMALAIALGRRGLGQCWPNPAVGAVIVEPGGRIVSCGWTGPGGRPHAEANALAEAGAAARGATLYATLEPCAHWGKTPPCADAIVESRIARVVYGVGDPDPRVAGKGLRRLHKAGIEVVSGPLPKEARWLTLGHELRLTAQRPFIQLKLAVDRAGMIPAGGGGIPVWATAKEARAAGHMLRAQADAILVGYGTMLADDPDLTCRLPNMQWRSPIRVVLSTDGRLSRHARMLKNLSTAPVWMVCAAGSPQAGLDRLEELGVTVIQAPKNAAGRLELPAVMRALAERGITRLLVEGGPSLEANLLKEDLADEVIIFQGDKEVREAAIMPFAPDGLESVTDSPIYQLCETRRIGPNRVWSYRRNTYWRD